MTGILQLKNKKTSKVHLTPVALAVIFKEIVNVLTFLKFRLREVVSYSINKITALFESIKEYLFNEATLKDNNCSMGAFVYWSGLKPCVEMGFEVRRSNFDLAWFTLLGITFQTTCTTQIHSKQLGSFLWIFGEYPLIHPLATHIKIFTLGYLQYENRNSIYKLIK